MMHKSKGLDKSMELKKSYGIKMCSSAEAQCKNESLISKRNNEFRKVQQIKRNKPFG